MDFSVHFVLMVLNTAELREDWANNASNPTQPCPTVYFPHRLVLYYSLKFFQFRILVSFCYHLIGELRSLSLKYTKNQGCHI